MKKVFLLIIAILFMHTTMTFAKNEKRKKDNTVTFYFIRHGKTIFNTVERIQGWSDTPLTTEGVEVAKYLGKGLQDIEFKSAYSSDLGRARQTARIVLDSKGQKDLNIIENPSLRETNFGKYEGELGSVMMRDVALFLQYPNTTDFLKELGTKPETLKKWLSTSKTLDDLGVAEDFDDVKERGQKAIQEIAELEANKGGGNVMVVAHGMAIGIFLSDLDSSGVQPRAGHIGNASVSTVTYKDGKYSLQSFGDMSYIERGEQISK